MSEKMEFPNTFEEFVNKHSFVDSDEVYTNGCELIQTFRVMQGYEHFVKQIRADAIDEALYEYAFWLFTNYSGGGAVGGSVAHDNAVKSIEEFKQMQKGEE